MIRPTYALALLVVIEACARTAATTDAGADVDPVVDAAVPVIDAPSIDAPSIDAPSIDAPVLQDASFPSEHPLDAAFMDGPAPGDGTPGGGCLGFTTREFCTEPCGACVNSTSTGACSTEAEALQREPECEMSTYYFRLCFAGCVLNADAAFSCVDYYGPRVRGCGCYEQCVAARPRACQGPQRAFDRCINSRCAACRF